MDGYEIPAEVRGEADKAATHAVREKIRADVAMAQTLYEASLIEAAVAAAAPLIAAAAYRAGQEQAAREIAEQIETTEWLNCTAFARKARDYEAMVTS